MPTRFVYITDTHLGAQQGIGYVQQPRYADRLPELLHLLDRWIVSQDEPIAFVLHGGDMVDATTPELIASASEQFALSVPIYLSLGNHDLTTPQALRLWLDLAPGFFAGPGPAYALAGDDWMVHVLPTQWDRMPFVWGDVQHPHLRREDLAGLKEALAAQPDKIHLLCTHAQVLAAPGDQVGRQVACHPPLASFSKTLGMVAAEFPQLRVILGGHNHINTHGLLREAHAVTGSAFPETPFEFKLVEIAQDSVSITTRTLLPEISFRARYDWDRTFVQGRHCDRGFGERFST